MLVAPAERKSSCRSQVWEEVPRAGSPAWSRRTRARLSVSSGPPALLAVVLHGAGNTKQFQRAPSLAAPLSLEECAVNMSADRLVPP